jgi:RNA polymerase subunit RPABC4/transcription elongation factor Spt4
MIMAVNSCPKCKTLLQSMLLIRRYNENESAALPKEFCPQCHTLELSGDDIDFFIFGGKDDQTRKRYMLF